MQNHFLSLGSNIEPKINMVRMIEALLKISETVVLSKIIKTKPIGLDSPNYFLNTVVCIQTDKDGLELKEQLVQIEEALGRDRNDPNRKYKDRTADLDILFALGEESKSISLSNVPKEEYVISPLLNLLDFLNIKQDEVTKNPELGSVELQIGDITIGKKAVRLY